MMQPHNVMNVSDGRAPNVNLICTNVILECLATLNLST
jgi:hypothetical protein